MKANEILLHDSKHGKLELAKISYVRDAYCGATRTIRLGLRGRSKVPWEGSNKTRRLVQADH